MEMRGVGGGGDEWQRCQRLSPHGTWRCNLMTVSGEIYCEKHFLRIQRDGEVRETRNMGNGGESFGGNGGSRKRKCDEVKRGVFNGGGSEREVIVGGSGGRMRKNGRLEGSDSKGNKKILEENEGGIIKSGRPKGSENKGKKKVLEEKDGRIRSDRRGRPKGSKNQKKIVVGSETEAMQVDDQSDVELVGMKDKGKIVWCKDEVFGRINEDGVNMVGVGVGPSNCQENIHSYDGLDKDIHRYVGDGVATPLQMEGAIGRPKGSTVKKKEVNANEKRDVTKDYASGDNNGFSSTRNSDGGNEVEMSKDRRPEISINQKYVEKIREHNENRYPERTKKEILKSGPFCCGDVSMDEKMAVVSLLEMHSGMHGG